jgi:hypothetical protein
MFTTFLIISGLILSLHCYHLHVENERLWKQDKDAIQYFESRLDSLRQELQKQRNLTKLWIQAWKEHTAAATLPPELLDCLWARNDDK